MSLEAWKWIAEKLGVPTLFAIVLCLAIYRTGVWAARVVVEPVVNAHVKFLQGEQESMSEIVKSVQRQTNILEDIRNDQRKFPAVSEKMP